MTRSIPGAGMGGSPFARGWIHRIQRTRAPSTRPQRTHTHGEASMVAQDPPILDPRHWLPEILLYTNAHREVWAVKRENVTWTDLVQAYQTQGIGKHPDSRWVGTRRVALRYVSSSAG